VLRGGRATGDEAAAWQQVEQVIDQFKSADRYLFAVPMWNFCVPYRLKQYVDILVQPGYTFGVTEEGGFEGLVVGKPAAVVYARGGEYPPQTDAAALDHQKSYFELMLGFMGFTDIRSIVVEPTLMQGPEVAEQRRAAAIEEARRLAADF
jgi:FMN-dependent NADH-azoreductase